MQIKNSRIKSAVDLLSIVAPIICLIDCVVIPAALVVLPFVGIHNVWHGISDQLLLLIVLAICTPTITLGFLQHKQKSVFALMGIGFALMFFANFAGDQIDNTVHCLFTTLGSFFLIKANWQNRKLSRGADCGCHHHACGP